LRRLLLAACLLGALLPLYANPARAHHDGLPQCAGERISGYIPVAQGTPDATTLHYQVLLPKDAGPGPYPAVMDYSGYQPGLHIWDGLHRHFTCEGYAVVGLNIRGTGCSGGDFDYFEPRQAEDGREAIEFLTEQSWSNGRLAMVGKSYPGITQLFVAGQPLEPGGEVDTPEGLVAIVPGHVFGDLYRDVPFPGGIMNVTFAAGWSAGRIYEPFQAPLEDQFNRQEFDQECSANTAAHAANPPQNPFVKAINNQYDGDLFKERSPWYWADNIEVPTFLIEAWQDEQVGSRATELTERFAPGLEWRMLATNGDHGEYYGSDVLPHIDDFLSFYLAQEIPDSYQGGTVTEVVPGGKKKPKPKKDTVVERPETFDEALARYEGNDPVRLNWETGAGGGRVPAWSTTYSDWPPPNQEVWRLHPTPDGKLADEAVDGTVPYRYAPGIGTQQRGGYKLTGDLPDETEASWSELPAEGTFAQFETDPLTSDKTMAGPGSLDLTLSSSAPDTDLQVTLTEVRPDGQEMFVQQGWLRASHRAEDSGLSTALRPYQTHLLEDVQPLVPGEPTEMRVEIFPFGHVFRAGSKIRLYVEAPHVKPDLWGFALLPVPAENTIHTGSSSLALPLLEGESAGAPLPPCPIRNQPCRPAP
jgi:uncharacterized protein